MTVDKKRKNLVSINSIPTIALETEINKTSTGNKRRVKCSVVACCPKKAKKCYSEMKRPLILMQSWCIFFPSLNNTDINSKNDGNKNGAANFLSGSEVPQDKNLIRNQNEKDTICQFHFSKDDQIFFF